MFNYYLEMSGLWFLAGFNPALRFIPMEKSGCSLQSGLGPRVSAPGNPGNEMLFWPNSPG